MPDKYKDLIELIVEEICDKEGLKIGEPFRLYRGSRDTDFGRLCLGKKGLGSEGYETNCNHIIFDILQGSYTVQKLY